MTRRRICIVAALLAVAPIAWGGFIIDSISGSQECYAELNGTYQNDYDLCIASQQVEVVEGPPDYAISWADTWTSASVDDWGSGSVLSISAGVDAGLDIAETQADSIYSEASIHNFEVRFQAPVADLYYYYSVIFQEAGFGSYLRIYNETAGTEILNVSGETTFGEDIHLPVNVGDEIRVTINMHVINNEPGSPFTTIDYMEHVDVSISPEPTSVLLLGLSGLVCLRRRR